MKHILAALSIVLIAPDALAQEPDENNLTLEAGIGALQANFSSDNDADISVSRYQPFLRFEYGSGRWVSNYTVLATEFTDISYSRRLKDPYRLRMNLASETNVFVAQGLKLHLIQTGAFRLHALVQYELSLWDLDAKLDSVVVNTANDEMDITDEAREHVTARYGWQRLQFALSADYALWRFTPFLTLGWNILDANITFSYDQESRDMLAIFGQEVPEEDTDHFRSGSLVGMVGTEFLAGWGISFRVEGIAAPDELGWVYAAQGSVIFRP